MLYSMLHAQQQQPKRRPPRYGCASANATLSTTRCSYGNALPSCKRQLLRRAALLATHPTPGLATASQPSSDTHTSTGDGLRCGSSRPPAPPHRCPLSQPSPPQTPRSPRIPHPPLLTCVAVAAAAAPLACTLRRNARHGRETHRPCHAWRPRKQAAATPPPPQRAITPPPPPGTNAR